VRIRDIISIFNKKSVRGELLNNKEEIRTLQKESSLVLADMVNISAYTRQSVAIYSPNEQDVTAAYLDKIEKTCVLAERCDILLDKLEKDLFAFGIRSLSNQEILHGLNAYGILKKDYMQIIHEANNLKKFFEHQLEQPNEKPTLAIAKNDDISIHDKISRTVEKRSSYPRDLDAIEI